MLTYTSLEKIQQKVTKRKIHRRHFFLARNKTRLFLFGMQIHVESQNSQPNGPFSLSLFIDFHCTLPVLSPLTSSAASSIGI
jgi:hypothetical protein